MSQLTRRTFCARAAGLAAPVAVFSIVPRHVLGGRGYTPPSEQLTQALIGAGGQGRSHIGWNKFKCLAICDVDSHRLAEGLKKAGPDAKGYRDWREVLTRDDIDIVDIATPPHWHALMTATAAEAGFDVWCEKPMTRTIGEGRRVVDTISRTGRIFRINTWFRFRSPFYQYGSTVQPIRKVVASGLLGWPLTATVGAATGFNWKFQWIGQSDQKPEPVPPELDYDLWLGPAPWKPYHPHRTHGTFRGYWDYDGGGLGDMGQHYLDPLQYILGKDDESPVAIEADCEQQHPDAVGVWRRVELRYADGCKIILDGENRDKDAPYLQGPKGKLFRNLESDIPRLVDRLAALPDPEPQPDDFAACVRERRRFALDERKAHRSCTLVNLAKIAVQLGRPLRFDPAAERFIGDEGANRLVDPPMRAPWDFGNLASLESGDC